MSEPTNPLFEEEKAFLERKKLEYERALRGDVALLKQQTADAGRVALVAGGLAGSIWLITKVFSSKKKKRAPESDYDYYGPDDYPTQHFGDYDYFDDDDDERDERRRWHSDVDAEVNDYFAEQEPADSYDSDEEHGTVYHSDTDHYDSPEAPNATDDLDDNGLHSYPDFPAHSAPTHGHDSHDEAGDAAERFESEAYGHPDSTLPFDDSRRLPESEDFAAPKAEDYDYEQHMVVNLYQPEPAKPKQNLGAMLLGLARTDLGKVVVGQAASLAMALATKAIKAKLTSDEPETPKNSDLADSTGQNDGYAHGHPATPQPDAHFTSAAASPE